MSAPAAYQHNGQSCSRSAFYAIACDPRRNVAVEACAGSGKTWMLVSRIVRALLDGAEPQDILAITFTRKAAGEMRERLHEWLASFARRKADETDAAWRQRLREELVQRGVTPAQAEAQADALRGLHERVLSSGQPLQIRTFHSWFAALLDGAPLALLQELGLPLQYQLLERDEDAVQQVWRPFLQRVANDPSLHDDYVALVHEHGRTKIQGALTDALARRVEFLLAEEAGAVEHAVASFAVEYPQFAGLDHPADWLLGRAAGRSLLEEAAHALQPLAPTFAQKGTDLLEALKAADWQQVVGALLTDQGKPRAFAKDKTPAVVRTAQDEVELVLAAQAQHDAWLYHQRMTRLVRVLIDSFAQLKRTRGWIDMPDIERVALLLLADDAMAAWVQQRLDQRVRHLLIDEFQDTNPLQWHALHAWLSGYAGAGGGPDAPSVFIVGDRKQSIYRFRRADPAVFAAAQKFVVEALDGEHLACDHTRRNASQVLALVNSVMDQAQQARQFSDFRLHTTESKAHGQVGALPLIPRPKKTAATTDALHWRDSLTEPQTEAEETLRTLECRQAAAWIAACVQRGTPPGRIMVLARKRAPLAVLQDELRALAIPCALAGHPMLADQPAVQDILALVDALLSPDNDLMLARALKSPLFGADDRDLVCLAQARQARAAASELDPLSWLDLLPSTPLVTLDHRAVHAELVQARRWLLSRPPHDALQAIYNQRDVYARFAAAAPAHERARVLANLRALPGAALAVEGGRFLNAYSWLRTLRRHPWPAPNPASDAAVQLLTVHGAKGLEADVVLLLDAAAETGKRRSEPVVVIDWPGAVPAPQRLVFLANSNAPPPSLKALARAEAGAQAREELNALYVAMTRACEQVVLSGVEPHHARTDSWWLRLHPLVPELSTPQTPGRAAAADGVFELRGLPALSIHTDRQV